MAEDYKATIDLNVGTAKGSGGTREKKESGAFAGGFLGSILGNLLSSVKQLFDPLNAIAGLLVAALFPLLKPFLILFIKVGLMLFRFLSNILGTESPVKGLTGTDPDTGETIVGEEGKKLGLTLGIIGGALVGVAALFTGLPVLLSAAIAIGVALLVKPLFEFGLWLGAKLIEAGMWIGEKLIQFGGWLAEKFLDFTGYLGDKLADIIIWISNKFSAFVEMLSNSWQKLKDFGTWIWKGLTDLLSSSWTNLKDFGTWIWDSLKAMFTKSFEVLSDIGTWIKNKIKSMFSIFGGGSKSVQDAIITPNGDVIRTNPNDYLIATKTPESFGGFGGGSSQINVSINGGMITEDVARDIGKIIQRQINMSGGF